MKKILLPLFLLSAIIIKAQIITTIAGTGTNGYSGDSGPATNAKIFYAEGMCFDSTGNLIFADYGNNRIRKISASTGIITTIAGKGVWGFSGDGGLAINAALNAPGDVKIDRAGNLYISDNENYRIRKVNAATGIITTIAGKGRNEGSYANYIPATSARISPASLCLDAAQNNLYLTDEYRIRKIDLITGLITTVAGKDYSGFSGDGGLATAALLNIPRSVFLDASDNLYIADMGNNRIRKVNAVTKTITTVAGSSATGGFSGDSGLATSAKLWYPSDMFVDTAGNMYIADMLNNRIRFISKSTGFITTIAGNGTAGYSGDGGLATSAALKHPNSVIVDANNNVIFGDIDNSRIRKISGTASLQGNALSKSARIAASGATSEMKLSFKVAPNPAKTNTTLLFQKNITGGLISVIDENGKTLYNTRFTGSQFLFNTSLLTPGTYFIRVFADNETSLKKIVIIK
jgi:trimeric autotransporter adhesin